MCVCVSVLIVDLSDEPKLIAKSSSDCQVYWWNRQFTGMTLCRNEGAIYSVTVNYSRDGLSKERCNTVIVTSLAIFPLAVSNSNCNILSNPLKINRQDMTSQMLSLLFFTDHVSEFDVCGYFRVIYSAFAVVL